MSYYGGFAPYVSVAERRAKAAKLAAKLARQGKNLDPVVISGKKIATSFWGKAWCDNLESYSDYENRLPRGRTYTRNGSVIDLQIASCEITAMVSGSSVYKATIGISPLPPERWKAFVRSASGKVGNLLDLLQGRLSKELLAEIAAQDTGLFPAPKEIKLRCSCPDSATMCKHIAAVLYGVGARLDSRPELFFTLRGVDIQDLFAAAGENVIAPLETSPDPALADSDLSSMFGVEIETSSPIVAESPTEPATPAKAKAAKKSPKPKEPTPTKPKKPAKKPAKKISAKKKAKQPVRTPKLPAQNS